MSYSRKVQEVFFGIPVFSLRPSSVSCSSPTVCPPLAATPILCGAVGKNPPSNAGEAEGIWVQTLGQEDPLEEELATHSSILAWKITYGQRSLAGYSPRDCKELGITDHKGMRPIPWGP